MVPPQLTRKNAFCRYWHYGVCKVFFGLRPITAIANKIGLQVCIALSELVDNGQRWRNVPARAPADCENSHRLLLYFVAD